MADCAGSSRPPIGTAAASPVDEHLHRRKISLELQEKWKYNKNVVDKKLDVQSRFQRLSLPFGKALSKTTSQQK
jgi:hypothetical protein